MRIFLLKGTKSIENSSVGVLCGSTSMFTDYAGGVQVWETVGQKGGVTVPGMSFETTQRTSSYTPVACS
jgi:hypothetical protein